MRRILGALAVAVLSSRPAAADTFLYATAGSQQRIDGFRVRGDGSLEPDPAVQHATVSTLPRRLIARGCTLYVAEDERVEVFHVGAAGKLTLIGATVNSKK